MHNNYYFQIKIVFFQFHLSNRILRDIRKPRGMSGGLGINKVLLINAKNINLCINQ